MRLVLLCHYAEIVDKLGGDDWPRTTSRDAFACLAVQESAVMDHVDEVTHRLMMRIGHHAVIQ